MENFFCYLINKSQTMIRCRINIFVRTLPKLANNYERTVNVVYVYISVK